MRVFPSTSVPVGAGAVGAVGAGFAGSSASAGKPRQSPTHMGIVRVRVRMRSSPVERGLRT